MTDSFSAREVAVLIEDLRSEFRHVSEGLPPLGEGMSDVKERLSVLESEVRSLKDAFKLFISGLIKRVDCLETKLGL